MSVTYDEEEFLNGMNFPYFSEYNEIFLCCIIFVFMVFVDERQSEPQNAFKMRFLWIYFEKFLVVTEKS
jgi:hypothetical protein